METGIDPAITNYFSILPYFLLSLFISLMATPLVGKLAHKIGALDLPARLHKASEDSTTRINTKITARLGGLSIVLAIGLVLLISDRLGFSSLSNMAGFNSLGIWAGVAVLTIAGIYDDVKSLPAWIQFIVQFTAAGFVVLAGVELDSLSVGNEILTVLGSWDIPFLFGLSFQLPADLIIIVWIVSIINFVNWASGVDALHGGLSAVVLTTLLLIAMQNGNPILATLIAIHLGGVLGVLPFNYHPSKIFYGFGESINGFLIAVFAISGDIKFATSLIILGLPFVDALWVIVNRMRRTSKENGSIKDILLSTMKGDKTHLHHRLLEMGFSWKTVFFIELAITLVFALVAFQSAGFSVQQRTIQLVFALLVLVIIFIIINILRNRRKQQELSDKLAGIEQATVKVKIKRQEINPEEEEKFIY